MTELKKIIKTTDKYIRILNDNGIHDLKSLLQYFPRTYEDRSKIYNLNEIPIDNKTIVSTKGIIESKKFIPRGGRKFYEIKFQDQNGDLGYITIFNSPYIVKQIEKNKNYIIIGKPKFQYGKIIFTQPELIKTDNLDTSQDVYNFGRLYPIYSELNGIKPNRFAKKIRYSLNHVDNIFEEYLPQEFIEKFGLLEITKSIKNIHFPSNEKLKKNSIKRIFFDKLLKIQLNGLINKINYQKNKKNTKQINKNRQIIKNIIDIIDFELTNAQKKVIKSTIEELHDPKPMLKLLQGDVGSGKTIVATIIAYYTKKIFNGQSVFLAPLEVLANQHYITLAKYLLPLGLNIQLLKGSLSKNQKNKIKQDLIIGKIDILIGTHAIIQDDVEFKKLDFVVIDEQHKFGVKQRAFFKKHNSPNILQMSATPIPRSMALAFFGEFSISIIDEMPIGRKKIYTKIINEKEFHKLKPWILSKLNQGQRLFIVTPLIEESEKIEDVKSAITEFEKIKNLYPEKKSEIGLLHGKLKVKDKDKIMKDFKEGKLKILVSTTVIEVGVDIPEATIMIIMNSERFGLSQLHQLRGRIGRSELQSYCFLETKNKAGQSYKRLKAMEETNDGFKLAELDLQNRGTGEILGIRQSGESDIPIEILSNIKFIEKVQEGAQRLLNKYPDLNGLNLLKEKLTNSGSNLII